MKIFVLLFSISLSWACDQGINNPYQFIVPANYDTGISHDEFISAIDKFNNKFVEKMYYEHGVDLVLYHSWSSETVNAYADRSGNNYNITIYGGVARFPGMTQDAFSLILCHELGHHIGGVPQKNANKWSSVEGQADYFAVTKCLRQLWNDDDNLEIIQSFFVPAFIYGACSNSFVSEEEQALCVRTTYAGFITSRFLQYLDYEYVDTMFETPDPEIVESTKMVWPSAQCRLDTYFYGALCPVSKDIPMDDYSHHYGACTRAQGLEWGSRPQCWYKPRAI